jgi:hypothetical protein
MIEYWQQAWAFHIWSVIAVVGAALSLISIVADRRRQKRTSIEAVGFMPWTGISVFAMMVTFMALLLAIKQG